MIGQTISHYKITEKLGEGGMGVVYKAEDTKLDRPVALKFLAAHLVSDEEVRKRFEREAKAAAGLHHPNICTVHEINEFEGKTFIAMAFLEGEGLDKKIEAGPLKLKDALDIAIQTAQGLQAAHEKGIVHRDIKPANLMVTGSGSKQHVTIMDFGLAQLADRSKLTRTDETMGTVTYMSPEQTYGMELDHRTDLWSLGVVIYEMVTGQQPFKGHYDKAVMYSITNEEPEPMTALRTGVPMELELLVNKCLAKGADERYQHTDELLLDLQGLRKKLESGESTILPAVSVGGVGTSAYVGPSQNLQQADSLRSRGPLTKYRVIDEGRVTGDVVRYVAEDTELHRSVAIRVLPQSLEQQTERSQSRKQTVAFGVGALGALFGLVFAGLLLFAPAPVAEAPLRRFILPTEGSIRQPSISPNGRHVAYLTSPGILRVQDLHQNEPRVIFGPGASGWPAWSPDSEFIAFRSRDDRDELKKIAATGGAAVTLCEIDGYFAGAVWTPDGESIVFSLNRHLYRVSSRGGSPTLLLDATQEEAAEPVRPAFLGLEGGSDRLLYGQETGRFGAEIFAFERSSGQRERLVPGVGAVYAPNGYIVYQRPGRPSLWALPFSVNTLKATGEPFLVTENGVWPSVANDGMLVYLEVPGERSGRQRQLVWRDRQGNRLGTIGQPQDSIVYPALSPTGKHVAVWAVEADSNDIWIHDVDRPVKTRLTTNEAADLAPTWSPTGEQIVFSSGRTNRRDLYIKNADGGGEARLLLSNPERAQWVTGWSQAGNLLVGWRRPQSGFGDQADLFYLRRKEDGSSYEEVAFLETPFDEQTPQLSPDGDYLAYVSDESGRFEVYVQSFPKGGGKHRISIAGGRSPRWRADGREIFYVEEDTLVAVAISTSPRLTVSQPERLFSSVAFSNPGSAGSYLNYDVTEEGEKFVLPEFFEDESQDSAGSEERVDPVIRVVQNWHAEFRDREQD